VNLTESGYGDDSPKWMMNGKLMIWFTDRDGMKNHGSWGGESDVYGMFFHQGRLGPLQAEQGRLRHLKGKGREGRQGRQGGT
jgi:hypothetical protein